VGLRNDKEKHSEIYMYSFFKNILRLQINIFTKKVNTCQDKASQPINNHPAKTNNTVALRIALFNNLSVTYNLLFI